MKASIHPTYHQDVPVTCACGKKFTTGSVSSTLSVEVCYKCHPFYSGEQRFLDAKGRVEVFIKKQQVAKQYQSTQKTKKAKKSDKGDNRPKTLRELLGEI